MIIEQREAMADFNDDPNVRVAIVAGAGRAFSGGADLKEAQRDQEDDSAGKRRERVEASGHPASPLRRLHSACRRSNGVSLPSTAFSTSLA